MECEKCSTLIDKTDKQYDPYVDSPRRGGCATCKSASIKYDKFPCKECAEEETTTAKFPRHQKAKITYPR